MAHYRAYFIGIDGLFVKSIDLDCVDDAAAIENAKQLVDGQDVELWQRDRRIQKFKARSHYRDGQ